MAAPRFYEEILFGCCWFWRQWWRFKLNDECFPLWRVWRRDGGWMMHWCSYVGSLLDRPQYRASGRGAGRFQFFKKGRENGQTGAAPFYIGIRNLERKRRERALAGASPPTKFAEIRESGLPKLARRASARIVYVGIQ